MKALLLSFAFVLGAFTSAFANNCDVGGGCFISCPEPKICYAFFDNLGICRKGCNNPSVERKTIKMLSEGLTKEENMKLLNGEALDLKDTEVK
ncbi:MULTISPECIES: hypothetical protein [unclassified Mesorhizobium]|uniref:hypothetical protein n=1 Tax=unclassified Mesorhizobium TaxID=325217 RepID=UPI0011278BE0|nr:MULTISPECIES: hypothetical protein [unclassified Mesorhizobium]TPI56165.1 hypothetical protein FJW11_00515 [Mesorhizobium sp. B3-1-1]TPJ70515.1 hypothetical protein FJ462_07445 [Mesorhizobium sp. B2-6-7]TPJ89292.1 hypothetical protein FJ422_05365 [Mesorhizobium sp. B2-6-3]TPK04373.1 hypothetical protein FJ491_05365 [Mesorhizobium sp. B2-5-10]TPK14813.1 hypothetical protein FJ490_05760 [Mesorhizobium sp. B2-5-11]